MDYCKVKLYRIFQDLLNIFFVKKRVETKIKGGYFPFWNFFSKIFSSGILLMYQCNRYKVYKHVIDPLYSIPGYEVSVVCMGMCTL